MTEAATVTARAPAAERAERMDWTGLATMSALVVLAALLSVALSGHQSGQNNNLFHMAILEKLWDEPQFAQDTFIQSLRYYSSGFWMALQGLADEKTALAFFLPLQILSRIVFFVGVFLLAKPLGLVERRHQAVFLLLVALAATLRGASHAGGGGMFINSFTHSELANGTLLIALALSARAQFGLALVAAGVTFFLNLFMAVWLAPAMAVLLVLALREREIDLPRFLRSAVPGGLVAALLTAPVLANLVGNPEFGARPDFDYRTFLVEYWPYHFLVWETPLRELVAYAAVVLAGLVASWMQPQPARRALIVMIASFSAVWLLGTVAPLLTSSPTILNLHLLRSSAIVEILATLAIAAAGARMLRSKADADRNVWGPAVLVLLAVKAVFTPLVIALAAARFLWSPPRFVARPVLALAVFALVAGLSVYKVTKSVADDRRFLAMQRPWVAMATWARESTPTWAVFLLPVANIQPSSPLPKSSPEQEKVEAGSEVFVSLAHRRFWVSGKEGAAVMWSPSYYAEWRTRFVETLGLGSLAERLAYAQTHDIAVVVDACDQPDAPEPTFRTEGLCAYSVAEG